MNTFQDALIVEKNVFISVVIAELLYVGMVKRESLVPIVTKQEFLKLRNHLILEEGAINQIYLWNYNEEQK